MVTKNDITGDEIKSKSNSDKYSDGWDALFGSADMNEVFEVPVGEDTRPKDRVKQGISPSCVIEEIDFRGVKK